jgi:predicted AlkP superfamily pyrophosphatase or phosphodiesterase
MKSYKLIALGLLPMACSAAQSAPPQKPKLIVAIAVDQFSSDVFNEYRTTYTAGLKRLSGGVIFPSGYQGHAATETCPGHSTILTGSRPSRTGIIANDWQDPNLERKTKKGEATFEIYCAEAPGPAGSDASAQVTSSAFLKVPTLGDRLKAVDARTRVLAVSGKDRAAVMMGGHKADLTVWWNGKAFGTYAGRDVMIPTALNSINARAAAAVAKPVAIPLPKHCAALSRPFAVNSNVTIGTLVPRKAGEERPWRATPEFDAMTLDVALAAQKAMKLGSGPATDVLAISFSGPDYVGHSYGTSGAEMCAQIANLDLQIGRLMTALDATKVPYTVVLTADHGGTDATERNDAQGLPQAERADIGLSAMIMGQAVGKAVGIGGNPLIGRANFGDMYLSNTVPADKRKAVLETAATLYEQHPQVAAVFTKQELMAMSSPTGPVEDWSLIERARASFHPDHSGDFIVFLRRYVSPIPAGGSGYISTHGSPWGYDRRVPILFWWQGAAPFEQPNGVETADIMPTLASLVGLTVPADEIDGRCLDLVAGIDSNCPKTGR